MQTLTSAEAAARLDLPLAKVYRLVRDGVLKKHGNGHALRITVESVEKYLRTRPK